MPRDVYPNISVTFCGTDSLYLTTNSGELQIGT